MEAKVTRQGLSLTETLLLLAVIGILIGFATPNFLRWRAATTVKQAAVQLATDIDNERTTVRRTNVASTVLLNAGTDSYTIDGVSKTLPSNVDLQTSTATLTFEPPYGTTDTTTNLRSFTVSWQNDNSITRVVRVVGITGKVIVQ